MAFGVCVSAQAASVAVTNGGFEDRAVSSYSNFVSANIGTWIFNSLDGWTQNRFNSDAFFTFRPIIEQTYFRSPEYFQDGNAQVAALSGNASLYQKVGKVSADTDYEITFGIGTRQGVPGRGSVALFVSDQTGFHNLFTTTGIVPITQFLSDIITPEIGSFQTESFTTTAEQLEGFEGADLFVGIMARSGSAQVAFDNVAIRAITAVPIPAVGLLFPFGAAAFAFCASRKQRSRPA